MELFTLIVINIVTAVALYILFSVRFSLAVDKIVERTRKNVVLKDLRENVEATVEYINTSLDLMDQKNRSFYQLVRRSEELIQKLEARPEFSIDLASNPGTTADGDEYPGSLTEQEINALQAPLNETPADGPREKNLRDTPRIPAEYAGDSEIPEQESEPPLDPDAGAGSGSEGQSGATTMDRVLEALGDDRVEISNDGGGSAEEMFRRGEQSAGFARRFQSGPETDPEESDETPTAGRRFQPARRPGPSLKEGLYPAGSGFTMDEVGRPESAARAVTEGGLLSFIEGAGRTVRRIFGMSEPLNAKTGSDSGPAGLPATKSARTGGESSRRDWRSPPANEPEENPFDLLLREKQERLATPAEAVARPDQYLPADDDRVPPEEGGAPESMTDFQRERAAGANQTDSVETPETAELRQRIRNSTPAGRREIILQMVERGYSRQNISSLTGIGKAEVDLVATMPAPPVRRRRFRKQDT